MVIGRGTEAHMDADGDAYSRGGGKKRVPIGMLIRREKDACRDVCKDAYTKGEGEGAVKGADGDAYRDAHRAPVRMCIGRGRDA